MNFDSEIIHYHNQHDGVTISSQANVFCFRLFEHETLVHIPMGLTLSFFAKFRIFRRLFRLCNSSAWPLFNSDGVFDRAIIIYKYRIYVYKDGNVSEVFRLANTRVIMPGSHAITKSGHIYFGDYCSNRSRQEPVCIYRSTDRGDTWSIAHQFPIGSIKHIHSINWDCYDSSIWIFTGDRDTESHVYKTDEMFSKLVHVGGGSQLWRACSCFFTEESVYWGMDSPLSKCFIIRYDRKQHNLSKVAPLLGPCWYSREVEGLYFVSTSSEPHSYANSENPKNDGFLYVSKDLIEWRIVAMFKKDIAPWIFQFGSMSFSEGAIDRLDSVFLSYTGFAGKDGHVEKLSSLMDKKNEF